MNLIPQFDGETLRQAIMAESAEILGLMRAMEMPVNRANKARFRKLLKQKERLIEFTQWNMGILGL